MKLKSNKKIIALSLSLVVAAVFLLANPARAGWGIDILSGICQAIVSALGWVLLKIMGVLVYFAQYNGFIKSAAVTNGWVIVRDICNMFFVLILLVIAFATILQVEEYSYKKWLPKLILMAILINFSKTICGLLIDAAQIVMLTFVNSFKDIAGGNLTSALGIEKWQTIQNDVVDKVSSWEVAASLVLAVIYVIIAIIVVSAMLAMIAMRIVMIWIFVVLSPIAYLASAFPAGKKYASRWWSEFTQNLMVGPVLAFFLWLSFTSLASFNSNAFITNSGNVDIGGGKATTTAAAAPFGTSEVMVKYIVAIGMLLGGMKIAQEIGGDAAKAAGSVFNKGNSMAIGGAKWIGGGVGAGVGAITGYNFAKRKYGEFQKRTKEKIEAKSDLAYETVKGGVKGLYKGTKNVVVGGFRPNPKTDEQKMEEKERYDAFKEGAGRSATGFNGQELPKMSDKEAKAYEKSERRTTKKEDKKNKAAEDKRIYDAYTNKVYKDENGEAFKYDEETNKYVNKNGDTAKRKGKKEGEEGEEIEKMSDTTARFKAGMSDGMTKANALRNVGQEKKQDEQQKILEASGASVTDLKRIMNDSGINKNRRLAAAMTLAITNGFKNNNHAAGRQDVNNAKSLIGNNEVVLKKFNEAVNKSYAHLNHNLETAGGKAGFKKGMDEGKFDGYSLDSSAYNSSDLIKTLKDYSGLDFADNISRVSSKSAQHRNNTNEGLLKAKDQDLSQPGNALWDGAKQDLNAYAKLIARLSGNMKNAFSHPDGTFDGESEQALNKYMTMAKPSWLGNFDNDQLKKDGSNDAIVDAINKAMVKSVGLNTISSLEKSGTNPELVRRMLGAIEKLGSVEQKKAVLDNPALRHVNVIVPAP